MSKQQHLTIVEVGPRDGFQSVGPFIPTDLKIEIISRLYSAGIRRMEATSFVSQTALPQLADAAEILEAAASLDELDIQVLVPNARHAERALEAGARHLSLVMSISEPHNLSNIRRTPAESVADLKSLAASLPDDCKLRLNLATAFDCPFRGPVSEDAVFAILDQLSTTWPDAEIAFCDTTGRARPADVHRLFSQAGQRFANSCAWAFHGHDTYGLGAANAFAAWSAGVRVFDASVAGLGGCPFAPGATGNVATEDLVWMFGGKEGSGIDLDLLLSAARQVTSLPGAQIGGRVRDAMAARLSPEGVVA